jgi:hypothetical protein
MITKPTTLILGAGASAPFGFPTGYELLSRVVEWANINIGSTNPNLFLGFNPDPLPRANSIARWQPAATGNPPAATFVAHFNFPLSAFHIFRALPFLFPIIQRRHGDFRLRPTKRDYGGTSRRGGTT